MTTVLRAVPKGFVNTPAIERITVRALRYLQSGFSVHLRGPAGTGKTTLALHLADLLNRPIMLIFGDDELKSSDMIGNQTGYTRKKVVDNFIHSVVKLEDSLKQNWIDSRLTLACREGFTLVYDEFNRSRPEVNNVLLSALEEKLLVLPPNNSRSEYIRVNPHFRAIFTSNPEEYCGVYSTQDALLDRLITMNMPEPDEATQQEILIQKVAVTPEEAQTIVTLVQQFREATHAIAPSKIQTVARQQTNADKASGLRPSLMLARICQEHNIPIVPIDPDFQEVCRDILLSRAMGNIAELESRLNQIFDHLSGMENHQILALPPREELNTSSVPNNLSDTEQKIYTYIKDSDGARVSEIEIALGLNRVQTTDALRSLLRKSYLTQQDNRLFVVYEGD
ncbi:gas vesicle protein GvpN [Arthrospira sp. O9.13F]|nr:gas vesicle protein GvpN [Arthrospira sp. O9.13F]